MEEEEPPVVKKRTLAQRGWNEAKTIIVGALVFVAAFQWRDLIQHLLKKLENRVGGGRFPKTLVMFLIAVSVTVLCVLVLCTQQEDIQSTSLMQAGVAHVKKRIGKIQGNKQE